MSNTTMDLSNAYRAISPMFRKNMRLQTYKNWPFSSSDVCNANNMAAAGFYCIGGKDEPDLVECFLCCKQLDGWESTDDPWEEHKKHQPNCQFIQLNKQDEGSMTVKDLFYLIKVYHKQKNNLEFENSLKTLKSEWKDELIPDFYNALKKNQKKPKDSL
ncbi:baculoviral IAP repeat-containing protein 5 [Copidosoma floridanum]|uniref:baculoviral IAP repeat-containing protein 5 n=1 Tax=Copidosoma floridanum TaxID=29053 RepID=UPI0006C9B33E|nr:baculoviral IAP repeat-containing protein 5 [Copidosoma floridanum]